MDRTTRIKVAWSALLSLFWAVFLWNFWSRGVEALGLNAAVHLAALFGLFVWTMREEGIRWRKNLFWLVPIGLIILSFALYDNPFLKTVSLLVLPVAFAVFYNFAFLEMSRSLHWDSRLVGKLVSRGLSLIGSLGKSVAAHVGIFSSAKAQNGLVRRILLGLFLFVAIALTIVVPLLSSADTVFAASLQGLLTWFRNLFGTAIAYKILVGLLFSVLTTAAVFAWGRRHAHRPGEDGETQTDSVVVGIVLGGILLLYLFFLAIQFRNIWVGSLPFDFETAVQLVKSGFWQLLVLSVLNIAVYFLAYRKTVPLVQRILGAFTFASFLLLISAGHRMALYVAHYGLSYEKLFAAYTVLFCAVLFVWLISRLFVPYRSNILKFLVVLFVWMFGVAAVLPVEQLILRTNVALSKTDGSRVRLYELTMLSPDVLNLVRHYQATGKLRENPYYLQQARRHSPPGMSDDDLQPDWGFWLESRERQTCRKAWYEKTVANWAVSCPERE